MADYKIEDILKAVNDSEGSVDIREHLPTIQNYASKCEHVTELGVRWVVSTWSLMAALPKKLRSFDIEHFSKYGVDENILNEVSKDLGVDFKFYQEDVLLTDKIEETDLLFIDTLHNYKQLKMELHLHGNKARKYLIFHDTASFGEEDEAPLEPNPLWGNDLMEYYNSLKDWNGINPAIIEFIMANSNWHFDYVATNNNGLTVLRRD